MHGTATHAAGTTGAAHSGSTGALRIGARSTGSSGAAHDGLAGTDGSTINWLAGNGAGRARGRAGTRGSGNRGRGRCGTRKPCSQVGPRRNNGTRGGLAGQIRTCRRAERTSRARCSGLLRTAGSRSDRHLRRPHRGWAWRGRRGAAGYSRHAGNSRNGRSRRARGTWHRSFGLRRRGRSHSNRRCGSRRRRRRRQRSRRRQCRRNRQRLSGAGNNLSGLGRRSRRRCGPRRNRNAARRKRRRQRSSTQQWRTQRNRGTRRRRHALSGFFRGSFFFLRFGLGSRSRCGHRRIRRLRCLPRSFVGLFARLRGHATGSEVPPDNERVVFIERARVGLLFVYAQLG